MITGDDYILLAGKLAASPTAGEASYRSAVSRAYYGAFHLAADFLVELGFKVPKGPSAHGWIPQVLHGSGQQDAKDAGHFLEDLHSERIVADYHWQNQATGKQDDARTSVETAHEVRSSLNACRLESARSETGAGIEKYLRDRAGRGSGHR
ncbi:MAG TPA: HEPN domain-containing protein [Pirellulales bacterium]|nr:HEPN domain-containing protein [Pirellulales bacterium]